MVGGTKSKELLVSCSRSNVKMHGRLQVCNISYLEVFDKYSISYRNQFMWIFGFVGIRFLAGNRWMGTHLSDTNNNTRQMYSPTWKIGCSWICWKWNNRGNLFWLQLLCVSLFFLVSLDRGCGEYLPYSIWEKNSTKGI